MLSKRYSDMLGDDNRPTAKTTSRKRNKLFEEVVSDMKKQESRMRRRQVTEGGGRMLEYYVDRDRAAGVAMGSKDIKRQMKKIGDIADLPQLDREDSDWEVFYKFGLQQMLKKEFAKALLNFDYAVNTEKFDIKVLLGRCRCHLAMGQFRKAFHDADRVVDHGPPPSLIKGRRWRRNRRLTAK